MAIGVGSVSSVTLVTVTFASLGEPSTICESFRDVSIRNLHCSDDAGVRLLYETATAYGSDDPSDILSAISCFPGVSDDAMSGSLIAPCVCASNAIASPTFLPSRTSWIEPAAVGCARALSYVTMARSASTVDWVDPNRPALQE